MGFTTPETATQSPESVEPRPDSFCRFARSPVSATISGTSTSGVLGRAYLKPVLGVSSALRSRAPRPEAPGISAKVVDSPMAD